VPGLIRSRHAPVPKLCQNPTFSFRSSYLRAKSRFPDLLETLVVKSDGWSCWTQVSCAQGRRTRRLFRLFQLASGGGCNALRAQALFSSLSFRSPPPLPTFPFLTISYRFARELKGALSPRYLRRQHQMNHFAVCFSQGGGNRMRVDIHGRPNICVSQ
jgi:hypothetical protein